METTMIHVQWLNGGDAFLSPSKFKFQPTDTPGVDHATNLESGNGFFCKVIRKITPTLTGEVIQFAEDGSRL